MESSINNMVNRMATILSGNNPSIYLFGSVVLDDFRLGWSDIDIICLAEEVLSEEQAQVLFGRDFKDKISYPTENEIKSAVENHYQVIRRYARKTNRSVTSAGWLFDIARCLYTLRTGAII